jgi:hypothetical protein
MIISSLATQVSAENEAWLGGFKSSTMIVMITAKTPSENAPIRSRVGF